MGFSHSTSLPASMAAMEIRACQPGWRGDGHHVDVLALQHAAEVGVDRLVVGLVVELHVALGQQPDAWAQAARRSRRRGRRSRSGRRRTSRWAASGRPRPGRAAARWSGRRRRRRALQELPAADRAVCLASWKCLRRGMTVVLESRARSHTCNPVGPRLQPPGVGPGGPRVSSSRLARCQQWRPGTVAICLTGLLPSG